MDVYRALSADVPQVLFSILHQPRPGVPPEEYTRGLITLHNEIRAQFQAMNAQIEQWLQKQYIEQAEDTIYKLQRLGAFVEAFDLQAVQRLLLREYQRLGNRVGAASSFGLQASGEVIFNADMPTDRVLAQRVTEGHSYIASLGFTPGQGALHESWLLVHGSFHYDIITHLLRQHLNNYADLVASVTHASLNTYNLIYQIGESLVTAVESEHLTQDVVFAFGNGVMPSGSFRQAVAALMEEIGEDSQIIHASFWQRQLSLGTGKEFILRIHLPPGEEYVQTVLDAIAANGPVGEEVIVKEGKLLLGKHVV
ncbi:MAG: hypothetical protein ACJ788_12915 [Ktedonobacteraceae bacterium]